MGFKNAAAEAGLILLEPVMNVEVSVPQACVGDVTSDLNGRRGRVMGIEPKGKRQAVKAVVPMVEMERYGTDLRSLSQGRGDYSVSFSHYEEVPERIGTALIARRKGENEEEG